MFLLIHSEWCPRKKTWESETGGRLADNLDALIVMNCVCEFQALDVDMVLQSDRRQGQIIMPRSDNL